MLNLVYVGNYRPQVGGAAISCHQLLQGLANRGCRCQVVASVTAAAEAETRAFDAAHPQLEFSRYRVPEYFNQPYGPPPADWDRATAAGVRSKLQAIINTKRPDALLLREGWIEFADQLAERHSIPTIALVRGNPTAAILAGTYPPELTSAYLDRLRRVDQVVTVAEHFLPGLHRLGIPNAMAIRSSVDTSVFSARPHDAALATRLGVQEQDVVVLYAGHIKSIKRPLDIALAAPEALRRNPRLLFVIVGEDVDGGTMRAEMVELARSAGVLDRFRFEPNVDYEKMPAYFDLADIVLAPSEREGLARLYLEAMASGKTLLASDIAAAREVVRHGDNGFLFPKGDVVDLAAQLARIAGDGALRERLGAAARLSVLRHDVGVVADQYLDVIQGCIERPLRRRLA